MRLHRLLTKATWNEDVGSKQRSQPEAQTAASGRVHAFAGRSQAAGSSPVRRGAVAARAAEGRGHLHEQASWYGVGAGAEHHGQARGSGGRCDSDDDRQDGATLLTGGTSRTKAALRAADQDLACPSLGERKQRASNQDWCAAGPHMWPECTRVELQELQMHHREGGRAGGPPTVQQATWSGDGGRGSRSSPAWNCRCSSWPEPACLSMLSCQDARFCETASLEDIVSLEFKLACTSKGCPS